jgi:hypothetical protein
VAEIKTPRLMDVAGECLMYAELNSKLPTQKERDMSIFSDIFNKIVGKIKGAVPGAKHHL